MKHTPNRPPSGLYFVYLEIDLFNTVFVLVHWFSPQTKNQLCRPGPMLPLVSHFEYTDRPFS